MFRLLCNVFFFSCVPDLCEKQVVKLAVVYVKTLVHLDVYKSACRNVYVHT